LWFPGPIRDDPGWLRSANSLAQIGFAIRQYVETHGHLPPAVVRGKDGTPLYSWRVLILPYLDESELYDEFQKDQAWDSASNKPLLEKMPRMFVPALGGSDDPPYSTRYQVFVGPGTAFEHDGLTWQDFPDGLANTFLVVEAKDPVPWTKPADLVYNPVEPIPPLACPFTKPTPVLGFNIKGTAGFNAFFADGSHRFISNETDEQTLRSLITRNGGESVDLSKVK
jgi:hypothetical protein